MCLCVSEKRPCVNDALAMVVMTGASASHNSLTNHVGIRSSLHCLFGVSCIIRDTSSTVMLVKPGNDGTSLRLMVSDGERLWRLK